MPPRRTLRLPVVTALLLPVLLTSCMPDDSASTGAIPTAPAAAGAAPMPAMGSGTAGGAHAGHDMAEPAPPNATPGAATPTFEALPTVETPPSAYAGDGLGGIFVALCAPSHRSADDPIVKPGLPGAAHSHEFFGNSGTDAYSTTASLLAEPESSCDVVEDESAYWFPTIYQDGEVVQPRELQVYYMDFVRTGRMVAPPPGFRMLAGDMTGQTDTEINGSVRLGWSCANENVTFSKRPPTTCTPDNPLAMRIDYPDCWDGRNLDSPDHASHVAYSTFDLGAFANACPPSHPVPIPQIRYNVHLPISDGTGLTLASGPVETIHADFLNAWQPERLTELVGQLNDGGLNPLPGVEDTVEEIVTGLGG